MARQISRVTMSDEQEVRYWTEALGCSKDELAAAVARVGNSIDAVRGVLHRHWAYGTFPLRDTPKDHRPNDQSRRLTGRPRRARKG